MPSEAKLIELASYLKNEEYATLFQDFAIDQKWYDGNIAIGDLLPNMGHRNFEPVLIPFASQFISRFKDHIGTSRVSVDREINPRQLQKDDTEAIQNKKIVEQFLRHLWRRVNRNHEGIRPFRDASSFLGLRGNVGFEFIFDKDADFPVKVDVHDPWSLLPDPVLRNKQYVFHSYTTTLAEVQRVYPKASIPDVEGSAETQVVSVLRYVDHEQWSILVNDKLVQDDIPNTYGFLPFAFAYNGLGMSVERADDQSIRTQAFKHTWRTRSLLYSIRNLLATRAKIDTASLRAILNAAFPIGKAINLDDAEDIELDPATLIKLRQEGEGGVNEDIQFDPMPTVDPSLAQMSERVAAAMEMSSGSRALSGVRQPGTSAALEFQLQLQQAQLIFGEAVESFEGALERIGEMALMVVEKSGTPITVAFQDPVNQQTLYKQTVDANVIDGFYDNEVHLRFKGEEEVAANRLATNISMAQQQGGPSMRWAFRDVEDYDYEAEQVFKLKERILLDPSIAAAGAQVVMQELGVVLQEEFAKERGREVESGMQQVFNDRNQQRQVESFLAQGVPGNRNQGRVTRPRQEDLDDAL
jgi:hypothetical protein